MEFLFGLLVGLFIPMPFRTTIINYLKKLYLKLTEIFKGKS